LRSILHPSTELASTYNIYRAVIDGAAIGADPELAPLLDMSSLWWGPGRTVVGIPVQKKEFYSLECPHPGDTGVAGEWNKRGDLELMKKTFSDFEPTVVKLMSKVKPENLLIWKLTQLPELESWVWENGKIVLIADGLEPSPLFLGHC
jgi:salicylate hydroxylase